MPLLVDCYNVLCSPMPSLLAGLDETRLCVLLTASPWGRGRVVVVCDGNPKPTSPDPEAVLPIRLIHAGSSRTADEVVIQQIDADTAPRRLTVVSDDRQIQKAARRRRCRVMTCQRFIKALTQIATRADEPVSRSGDPSKPINPRLSPRQVDEWLDVFEISTHDDRHARDDPLNMSDTMWNPNGNDDDDDDDAS